MRAFVIRTGRRLSPFGDPPGEALYGNTTVGAHVRALLEKRGFVVEEKDASDIVVGAAASAGSGPAVVIADHVFVSDRALGGFLAAAFDVVTAQKKPARLALAQTNSVNFTLPLSSAAREPFDDSGPGQKPAVKTNFLTRREAAADARVAYDCFFVDDVAAGVSGADLLARLRAEAVRVVVKKAELAFPMRMPTLGDGKNTILEMPLTSTQAHHIEHWVHILWLNQAAFGGRWFETVRSERVWCLARGLAVLPRLLWTRNPGVVTQSFVKRGKNVRIHPTANVEASFLGDNVVVGARASVRNSIVGDNVVIGDHASVLSSTLGNGVKVTPRTCVVWSAAYPDAILSNYKLQVSVIGKGASLSTWAGFIDAKLQGAVDVHHDGQLRSTERSFLGSCLGHGAHVGAKVLLLPGREVPNGALITMRDDELIRDVPADLPAGVAVVRDRGTLVPLTSLRAPSA